MRWLAIRQSLSTCLRSVLQQWHLRYHHQALSPAQSSLNAPQAGIVTITSYIPSLTAAAIATSIPPSGSVSGTVILDLPLAGYTTLTSYLPSLTTTSLVTAVQPSGTVPGTVVQNVPLAGYQTITSYLPSLTAPTVLASISASGSISGTIEIGVPLAGYSTVTSYIASIAAPVTSVVAQPVGQVPGIVQVDQPLAGYQTRTTYVAGLTGPTTLSTVSPVGTISGTYVVAQPLAGYVTSTTQISGVAPTTLTTISPVGTTPGTVVVAQPSCASTGLAYQIVENPFIQAAPADGSYAAFNANYFNRYYSGSQIDVENNGFCSPLNFSQTDPASAAVYGSGNVQMTYKATRYFGLVQVPTTGTYTFSFGVSGLGYLWFGNGATDNWGESNYQLKTVAGAAGGTYSATLTAGVFYPIIVLGGYSSGTASLGLSIRAPDGVAGGAANFLYQSACAPTSSSSLTLTTTSGAVLARATSSTVVNGVGVPCILSVFPTVPRALAYSSTITPWAGATTRVTTVLPSNTLTTALIWTQTPAACAPSSTHTVVYAYGASVATSTIATAPAGTGTVQVSCPSPSPACGNSGFSWAAYSNPFGGDSTPGFPSFDPTYFTSYSPDVGSGTTNSILQTFSSPGSSGLLGLGGTTVNFYGQTFTPSSGDAFVLDNTGYFYACASGYYTFRMDYADDLMLLWLGPTALSGYTRDNAVLSQTAQSSNSAVAQQYILGGTYFPVRVMYANSQGSYAFSFTILDPSGNQIEPSANGVNTLITGECSGGTYAPPFPHT